nr:VOC family protein [Ornithinibacillus hominis]
MKTNKGGIHVIRIGAVFVPVLNVEKAIHWYKEKLGLHHVGTWPENQGADFYFMEQRQYLTLVRVLEKPPTTFPDSTNYQNAYYNFTTTDIYSYHQELQQKGVTVTDVEEHGPIIGFDFFDFEGNKFGVVVENKDFKKE